MSKWTNLGIVVIVVAIAVGVYYFYQPDAGSVPLPPFDAEKSFEDGYILANAFFVESGVPTLSSLSNNDEIIYLSDDVFLGLKSDLTSFKSGVSASTYGEAEVPLKDLADIYVLETDYYIALKENADAESYPLSDDVCDELARLETNQQTLKNLIDAATSLSSKLSNFIADHPSEASVASIIPFQIDSIALEDNYTTSVILLERINEGCEMPQCTEPDCNSDPDRLKPPFDDIPNIPVVEPDVVEVDPIEQ